LWRCSGFCNSAAWIGSIAPRPPANALARKRRVVGRPRKSDRRPDSRSAILAAAAEEFAERGYDGTRMEHVADRAGFNKALVYKHFASREGLFEAVLDALFAKRQEIRRQLPENVGDILVAWSRANFADPAFCKLIMREALEHRGDEPVRAAERRAYYRGQIDQVRGLQNAESLPAGLEPKYLFLALLAVVTLPALLPQISDLVTDEDPDSEAFSDGWHRFLRDFAERMSGPLK
jgi:AcrR family transcriptional regulator